ncbi:MAG TPA: hypothetical protein VI299_17620 [Polyangiales bacterium]
MRSVHRSRSIFVALACVALCYPLRALRLQAVDAYRGALHYEDVYYLPSPSTLAVLSLGFHAALADLLWCKSLVYFGEEVLHRGEVQYVFQYTDAVLALDPDFQRPYSWIATAALYRPAKVTIDDGMRAAAYLERAVKRWPKDGELRWDYGSLLRFELAPLEKDPVKKRRLLELAAPQLELATRLGAGPPWLALNSAELLNKLGRSEQAIRQLEEMRAATRDPDLQREIDNKLQQLQVRTYVEAMRTAEGQFEREHAHSYPYLSDGLFFWVGSRPANDAYDSFISAGFAAPESEPTTTDDE